MLPPLPTRAMMPTLVGQFVGVDADVGHAQVGRGERVDALDADLPADAVVDLPAVAGVRRDARVFVDIRDIVVPLIPDAAGVEPVVVGVAEDDHARARSGPPIVPVG